MENKIDFLNQLENKEKQVKQKIVAVIVVFFMFVMVTSSFDQISITRAAADTANLLQNITAGILDVSTATTCGFNDVAAGTPLNSLCNFQVVNIQDYRASGAGWACTGYSTPLANGAGGNLLIPNTRIYWTPAAAIHAFNGASTTGTQTYSTTLALSAPRTLANAAVNAGMGYYNVPNTSLNVIIAITDYAANYNGTLTVSLT